MHKQNKVLLVEMKPSKQAFTLVELIVVITILAILWTIAFISLQWYSRDTRNSVRISDLSNINKMIWVKIAETWKVPAPEDYVEITASWTVLNYQWKAWEKVLDILWVFNWWKDPLDETYYTYSTNTNLTKYQLLWFLEWDSLSSNLNMLETTNAESDLSAREIKTKWDDLWIVIDFVTNEPVTETVDILNTTDTYKTVFASEEIVEWTWWELFTHFYNRSEELLEDKNFAKEDDSLVLYFDMETTTMSWTELVFKDLSQYWHNWSLGSSYVPWWINTKNWKWTELLWTWWVVVDAFEELKSDGLTINVLFKSNNLVQKKSSEEAWNKEYIWVYNYYYGIISQWDCTPVPPSTESDCAIHGNSWYLWAYDQKISDSYTWSTLNDKNWNVILTTITTWTYHNAEYTESNIITDWKWHFITLVKDNNNRILYLDWNKVLENNSIEWNIFESDLPLYIWTSWHTLDYDISIWIYDEVRIYNRALSSDEIEVLYNTTK